MKQWLNKCATETNDVVLNYCNLLKKDMMWVQ